MNQASLKLENWVWLQKFDASNSTILRIWKSYNDDSPTVHWLDMGGEVPYLRSNCCWERIPQSVLDELRLIPKEDRTPSREVAHNSSAYRMTLLRSLDLVSWELMLMWNLSERIEQDWCSKAESGPHWLEQWYVQDHVKVHPYRQEAIYLYYSKKMYSLLKDEEVPIFKTCDKR